MLPDACWTHFQEQEGRTFADIYTAFFSQMEEKWEQDREEYGDGAAVKYEMLSRTDCTGDSYETLKDQLKEVYGFEDDVFGICYVVTVKKATVGKLKEDISNRKYHVLQIDEKWYVAEVLTEML